jgi:hypothetical protein
LALCAGLAATAAEAQPRLEPEEEPGWFAGQRGFTAQFMVGPGGRNVYDVPVVGLDTEVAFGAQTRVGGFYGRHHFFVGRTPEGLTVLSNNWAPTWEAPVGALRLGLGPQMGILGFFRATTGDYSARMGGGLRVHAAWDFVASDHASGFLGLRGGLQGYQGPDDLIVLDAGLHIGLRLF